MIFACWHGVCWHKYDKYRTKSWQM